LYIEDFDFFCCDKKYTGDTYVYVYVIKSIVQKVLVSVLSILLSWGIGIGLVLVILFETSIGIGIANTFKKYC